MNATETLRAMLDERGVEWASAHEWEGRTFWPNAGGVNATASDWGRGLLVNAVMSPEQAIEATLGRGTCRPVISDNLTESEGTGDAWADCSECGHLLFVLTDPSSQPPRYCPNCGRRVVNEQ